MSGTIDDLRDTLAAHVRDLPPSAARTVAVQRRVRRIRRQRTAAGVVAVALVAGVSAVGVHIGQGRPSQVTYGQAAEYANGGRLAATADIDTRTATSAQAAFVATSGTLIVTQRSCTASPAQKLLVEILVNGTSVGSASCESPGQTSTTIQPGIVPGQRVAVTARLVFRESPTTPLTAEESAALPVTKVRVAFYQPVSRADYRFPPLPAKQADFPPVSSTGAGDQALAVSDGGAVLTVDVRRGLDVELDSVAPGVVTLDLDGHRIGTAQSWDYTLTTSWVRMTPAQLAAIGVSGGKAEHASLIATGSDFRVSEGGAAWQIRVLTPDDPSFRDAD